MNPRRALKLATRIDKLLQRELGEGIDVQRLLDQPLYARDVLLVCDALTGSELPSLASLFRRTLSDGAAPSGPKREVASIGNFLHSLFGPVPDGSRTKATAQPQRRHWFSAPPRPTAAEHVARANSGSSSGQGAAAKTAGN